MLNASPLRRDVQCDYPPDSSPGRLREEFHKVFAPKPEELSYVLSDDELKQVTRHFQVKVDMTKFNPLDHFYRIFKKRGSLKNRSAESTLRLLLKAYDRYKDDKEHTYTEKEIKEILEEEWDLRKAVFVRFLNKQKEKEKARHVQQVSNENEDCVIIENNSQPAEPVSVPEIPECAMEFFEALRAMGVGSQILQGPGSSQDSQDSQPTPILTNNLNSLQALDAELDSALSSENLIVDNQTNEIANSAPMSSQQNTELTPNLNSEEYQKFTTGNPVSSTQDP